MKPLGRLLSLSLLVMRVVRSNCLLIYQRAYTKSMHILGDEKCHSEPPYERILCTEGFAAGRFHV